ncbi:MAG: hypothetical protein A2623_09510 [Caulobacterales bacterium RIFCSPHIGHO2_01_FULL_70_19]|nr:MAG: hypothetical protein A2623_09510 [Caulobacterales bacterium RIFCSPHIGHO2_01_FULL_70_19]
MMSLTATRPQPLGGSPMLPAESEILSAARPLVAAGIAVHWLRRREKAPIDDGWSTAPVHTFETLRESYRSGSNLGIRAGEPSKTAAGYVHLIDIDIRDPKQAEDAWAALLAMWPEAREAPFVVSGSGGASKHLYFVSESPFRSRKLAHSAGFSMVWDAKKDREVKKWDWEIELFGTGKQAVLPPSIHPDTGEPYRWGRPLDVDLLEIGVGPLIPAAVVSGWGVSTVDHLSGDDDDDLFALVRSEPMGLTTAEIDDALAGLPPDWVEDRDCWLQVGQALHHEHQGQQAGFERWCEWSKASAKFDPKDQAAVWRSFGKGHVKNPVRMASIIKAAADHRLSVAHAALDDGFVEADDDLADLLGRPSTALTVLPAASAVDADLAELLGGTPHPITPRAAGVTRPPLVYDPEWRSFLQRNEDGIVKPTLPNVQLIVRNDVRLRGVVAFNEFTREVVLIRKPGTLRLQKEAPKPIRQLDGAIWTPRDPRNGSLWSDSHDHAVRALIEAPERQGGYGIKVSDRDLSGAIDLVAHENAFHPVRDYLAGLIWDGICRVERLFTEYLGAPDTPYHRESAVLFMVGAITRIFEPGHKFDFVPILEGTQGKRKSTFIRILGRSWACELEGDFHDTQGMVEKMQGAWICEIPELQGFSRAEVTTLKGFISRPVDKVRMAYARRAVEFHRSCVFMGSTNETEYLRDATGGRRFWPIACSVEEIDTDRLEAEIDQIWAEAKAMYATWREQSPAGSLPLYLRNAAASEEAAELQESRRQETADEVLAGQISAWLESPVGDGFGAEGVAHGELRSEVCLAEVRDHVLGLDRAKYDQRTQQMLGRAMRLVPGWRVAGQRNTKNYGKQRIFCRVH